MATKTIAKTDEEFKAGDDSIITNPSAFNRYTRKSHLELLLQKANSISGIRKINM